MSKFVDNFTTNNFIRPIVDGFVKSEYWAKGITAMLWLLILMVIACVTCATTGNPDGVRTGIIFYIAVVAIFVAYSLLTHKK